MSHLDVVGVIGLGAMGRPLASRLVEAGSSVLTFDAAPGIQEIPGAESVVGVEEIGRRCGVVLLSLPGPEAVLAVVGQLAARAPAPLVVDLSTVGPDTSTACAELIRAGGGDYLDAPVLGRPAKVGSWTLPTGGDPSRVAEVARLLEPVARVVRVGEVGAGATVKVLNNLMLGSINAITSEVLVLAEAAGLDPGEFVDVVTDSGAASVSGLFRDIGPRAVEGDFDPVFTVQLMHKDNALALDLAERHQVPMLVGRATQEVNDRALEHGDGAADSIAVIRALESVTGHEARRHRDGPESAR